MSTAAVRRRRWTRADYERVVAVGGFGPEDRIELLDGELWEMTPQGSRHAAVCGHVADRLRVAFTGGGVVREQSPIALDDRSEPEPDVAVIRGAHLDYVDGHPAALLLVVEVSESSLSHDRVRKLTAYARNAVPEYWLINLAAKTLEVYREPDGQRYASTSILGRGDTVTPLHAPNSPVRVADLLP